MNSSPTGGISTKSIVLVNGSSCRKSIQGWFYSLLFEGETVTPVVSMLAQEGPITSESLAEDTKKVLEEITR